MAKNSYTFKITLNEVVINIQTTKKEFNDEFSLLEKFNAIHVKYFPNEDNSWQLKEFASDINQIIFIRKSDSPLISYKSMLREALLILKNSVSTAEHKDGLQQLNALVCPSSINSNGYFWKNTADMPDLDQKTATVNSASL